MATLTNTKIKDTYDGLLKTTDNDALDVSGVTLIEDGLGNASALSVGRSGNGVTVTGDLTVDTDTLFVDATNNRVGVGTSSPSELLEVAGTILIDTVSAVTNAGLEITTANNRSGRILFNDSDASSQGRLVYNHSDDSMQLYSAGSERMRIDSSGNVGIGVVPTYQFEVGGVSQPRMAIVSTSATGASQLNFGDNSSGDVGRIRYSHNGDFMAMYTNGSEAMRIDSSGNVGIGVVPKSWSTAGGTKALQISTRGALFEAFDNVFLSNNAYYDGSERYIETNVAARLGCNSTGNIVFENAASGTAGSVLTWNERMRITSGGDVLIGITTAGAAGGTTIKEGVSSTDYAFQINASSTNQAKCISISSGQLTASHGMMNFSLANPGNGRFINFNAPDGGYTYADRGYIELSGTSVLYSSVSDYRLKENVVELTGALDRVDALKPSRFNFIGDDETIDGFIAHEVKEVVPQAVSGEKDAIDEEGNPIYQGIDQSKIVPLLVGAIKELRAEIETLKSQLNA